MRFIIHEQPYERPIVSGQLRYEQEGVPTGARELYRVTAAVDGYRFLRVDLDAREAPSGRSSLYHMTLNPAGQPEQLRFRFWGDGFAVAGVVVWDGEQLAAVREVNDFTYEDEAGVVPFWFPSGAGLSLLRTLAAAGARPAVTLNQDTSDPTRLMALLPVQVVVGEIETASFELTGQAHEASGYEVGWEGQWRRVWLQRDGWPLKVLRDDGLSAVATRFVIYH